MAGFEVWDENGKLQFNDQLLAYQLRVTGVAYVQGIKVGNTGSTSLQVPTTQTYSNCLVALSGGNGWTAAAVGASPSSGQRLYSTGNAPVGTPFNYFVYEQSNTVPQLNQGLEVFNAAGEITFSSNQRVMNVVDLLGSPTENDQATSRTGRQLAFFQGAFAGHSIPGERQAVEPGGPVIRDPGELGPPGSTYRFRMDGKLYGGAVLDNGQTVIARRVSFNDVTVDNGQDPNPPPTWIKTLNLFAVDVTDIPIGRQFF